MSKAKEEYTCPSLESHKIYAGLPTVLSVGAVSAAAGALAVAVSKAIGDDFYNFQHPTIKKQTIIYGEKDEE